MIKIENTHVDGFEAAIRGMRKPFKSEDQSDSYFEDGKFCIGPKDLKLACGLSNGSDSHSKFLRFLHVSCDTTSPLYWWKEMDQYKIGTVTDSESTMHTIQKKEFTLDDFSHEHLLDDAAWVTWDGQDYSNSAIECLYDVVSMLNAYRNQYLETKEKIYWWQLIQLLPSSYNQCRTWDANYQVLKRIHFERKDHKLDEWHDFCRWIEELPYARLLMHIEDGNG